MQVKDIKDFKAGQLNLILLSTSWKMHLKGARDRETTSKQNKMKQNRTKLFFFWRNQVTTDDCLGPEWSQKDWPLHDTGWNGELTELVDGLEVEEKVKGGSKDDSSVPGLSIWVELSVFY